MLYTAFIAHDYGGANHDVRIVHATRIDVLQRRMVKQARDLLNTYYTPEVQKHVTDNFKVYTPLPLVAFDSRLHDIAKDARRELKRGPWTVVTKGDLRWHFDDKLSAFSGSVECRK